ncbi:MAG: ATP-binding response regulator, partial [Acidimicrobiales bacterium]
GWAVVADVPARVALGEVRGLQAAVVAVTGALALVVLAGLVVLDRALRRRSAVEEELRRSRAFLDSVVENLPTTVFVKDAAELRYVSLNRAGEELLGRRRDEVVGRRDTEVFPLEQAAAFEAQDRDVLDGGRTVETAAVPVRAGGKGERVLHTRRIPIPGPDGAPQYLLGISEDVTERRRADAALEAARQAADGANRAKDRFLSRMSHELRTPLNAVLGFGQLLQLDGPGPDQRDSVDQIVRAGHHLLQLIDDVLDISRVETGELRLSVEPVSVAEVVAEAMGMMGPMAAARGVRLVADEPAGRPSHVQADRQRLRQVVVNLVANGIKYNRDGGEVAVRCEPSGAERLRLVVSDTGIGLAAHDLARLFQPFERLGAERTGVEGTGLGLVLTKQLVEAMGGTVDVTSEVGVGSSFAVELPLVALPWGDAGADRPGAADPGVDDPGGARPPPPLGPARTVLYVEDNLSNVRLVERVVARRPGVRLLVAMQGGLAVDLAREHRPGLVLLDLHLPDMSGEEVLRRLRADRRTAATPVVVLSADATAGEVERLRARGAADYLTKPFDVARLLALIDGTEDPGSL